MTKFGALIHAESADPAKSAAAIADLGLDLVVIGFVLSVYPIEMYDKFCNVIPQEKILAMVSLPTGADWSKVTPEVLAAQAKQISERYPGIQYFEVINEPDVEKYYPPVGIDHLTYKSYYDAVTAALPGKTVLGPNTSQWVYGYFNEETLAFHGYGLLPPLLPKSRFWMTECQDLTGGPVAVWSKFDGYAAAVYYQLQDSSDSPGSGLLDASGNPREPFYSAAKAWLKNPQPQKPWWDVLLQILFGWM